MSACTKYSNESSAHADEIGVCIFVSEVATQLQLPLRMNPTLGVLGSSVVAFVICAALTDGFWKHRTIETIDDPVNVLGALGDNISPGSFPEYRLSGKLPGTMPPAAKMISRTRLVDMIQGIETDRIKMHALREKVLELRAQDLSVRLQARTLMLKLKSDIVGLSDQNEQASGVDMCIPSQFQLV